MKVVFLGAVLTSEGIVFISDFSPSKAPASSGKKVYISSPHSSPSHNKLAAATGAKKALDKVKILISNEKPRQVANIYSQIMFCIPIYFIDIIKVCKVISFKKDNSLW